MDTDTLFHVLMAYNAKLTRRRAAVCHIICCNIFFQNHFFQFTKSLRKHKAKQTTVSAACKRCCTKDGTLSKNLVVIPLQTKLPETKNSIE
jgi:hypothetical protein